MSDRARGLPLLLKVLNGPHTGSQMQIRAKEELLVGTDDVCDVVLGDPHVAPRHASLVLDENGNLTIRSLEGAIYLDGLRVESETELVKPFQVVTLGSTHLVCGPVEGMWPAIAWPEIRETGVRTPSKSTGEDASPASPEIGGASLPRKPRRTHLLRVAAIALLILAGLIAVFVWGTEGGAGDRSNGDASKVVPLGEDDIFKPYTRGTLSQEEEDIYERVSRNIRAIAPRATVDASDLRGRLALMVYVDGMRELDAVQKLLNSEHAFIVAGVVDRTSTNESLQILVDQLGYDLDVEISGNGIAHWTGFLPSAEAWNEIQTKIASDVPRQRKNVPNLIYGTDIQASILSALAAAKLENWVRLEPTKTAMKFVGSLPPELNSTWKEAFAQMQADLSKTARLENAVAIGPPQAVAAAAAQTPVEKGKFFASAVVVIVPGERPWLRLANGEILFPGAQLKNGYILEGIEENLVVLTSGTKKLKISLEALD